MLIKTLIAAITCATFVIATTPAHASATVFGDRIFGLAAAITGNFITPERFDPSLGMLLQAPGEKNNRSAALDAGGKSSRI